MAVKKLLDENSLLAIKTYIDTYGGKVDDVKINDTSIVDSGKNAKIAVDGTYNASTNKIATISSITSAINALDVSNITGFGAGKTLATLTEANGLINATFQDIQITESQVTNLITDLASKVPTSRTIAGLDLTGNISSSALVNALGLSQALIFVGTSSTDPMSTSGATVSGHTTWKKGEVVLYNNLEYVNITGSNTSSTTPNPNWEEFGDAASYALKTTTISAGSGLSGGGSLASNRTISHATPTGATTTTSGFYKFSTDGFGHVNGTTAVAKADLTSLGVADDSLVAHLAGPETFSGKKTFSNGLNISGSGATAQFSVTNSSGDGELFIDGVAYLDAQSIFASFGFITTNYIDTNEGYTLYIGNSEGSAITLASAQSSDASNNNNLRYATNWNGTVSTYGVKFPDTHSYLADRTLATLSDIPSVSDFVKGPSSAAGAIDGNIVLFDGNTGRLVKDSGTALSTVTSHILDFNIHVTSANKTAWNGKVADVRMLEVTSATEGAGYQKLQQSKDSGSTYSDIIACMSYNEAWAILTATN